MLTGSLASGKAVVAEEIGGLLAGKEVPVAVIDLDWLAWGYFGPGPQSARTDELITANLRAIWSNFAAAGIESLALARALLRRLSLAAAVSALPEGDLR